MHGNNWVLTDKRRVCIESGHFGGVRTWRLVECAIDVMVRALFVVGFGLMASQAFLGPGPTPCGTQRAVRIAKTPIKDTALGVTLSPSEKILSAHPL
jgi:hypothetical protein